MDSGLMSTAYTIPASPTRFAARTVNQPEPAPISATFFPGAMPRMSITRSICNLSSRPGESKIERSPVYGVLVLRVSLDCCCRVAVVRHAATGRKKHQTRKRIQQRFIQHPETSTHKDRLDGTRLVSVLGIPARYLIDRRHLQMPGGRRCPPTSLTPVTGGTASPPAQDSNGAG